MDGLVLISGGQVVTAPSATQIRVRLRTFRRAVSTGITGKMMIKHVCGFQIDSLTID